MSGDMDSGGVEGLRVEVTASDRTERPHLLGVQSQRDFSSSFLSVLVSQSVRHHIILFHFTADLSIVPFIYSLHCTVLHYTVGSVCTLHRRRSDWHDTGTTGTPEACGTTDGVTSSGGRAPYPCSARVMCLQRSITTTRSTRTTSST